MVKSKAVVCSLLLVASSYALGEDSQPYVDGNEPFFMIEDVNRRAEAWGTCAAVYKVVAEIYKRKSQPLLARRFNDFANGASMAVTMTHVTDGFVSVKTEMTPERFGALWNYSISLSNSIPEAQENMILADFEATERANMPTFYKKLKATVKICMANLTDQQSHIDNARMMAKSGLLKTR